ncbi:hypothetical protein CEXT_105171, partial [Caerostris extrusa]
VTQNQYEIVKEEKKDQSHLFQYEFQPTNEKKNSPTTEFLLLRDHIRGITDISVSPTQRNPVTSTSPPR